MHKFSVAPFLATRRGLLRIGRHFSRLYGRLLPLRGEFLRYELLVELLFRVPGQLALHVGAGACSEDVGSNDI